MTTRELIEQTKKLMAIRSTADQPEALKEAVDFVANIVAKHKNITIERFERNGKSSFLAYRKGLRPKQFDILLNAHIDIVPARPALFEPYEKDGRLYGRGALDMKGTALVLTDVFCELVHAVPYALGLQIVSDEEIGGYDGVRMHIDDYGVRAKFTIMGEYANERGVIYNEARGLCWAEIAFRGKSAHGGHLWHGSNAVVKAGEFAGAVLKRYPTPDKETWTTTASISDLSTPNDAYNKVPDKAVLKIDFRFTQEDPVFRNRESLEAFIHEIDPEAELVNTATFEPAVHVDELNPYVQGLSQALESLTGSRPQFKGRPASSDGRHFAMVNNDIVEFGLYGKGSHSNNEYVELSSYDEYQEVLRRFLRQPIPEKLEKAIETVPLHEQLLRQLVEIPTVSGDFVANNKAFALVEKFLSDRGMFVERIDINGFRSIFATTRKGNKRPAVLLNAHLDVVPGPDQLFRLTLKDGKFYGRGVMDTKHATATYLAAIDNLKNELENYDLGIMITSDEELGSGNGAKRLVEMGYGAEVVIIPDGGNDWKLETFSKGAKWIKLEASGKTAHASRPWEGESAIKRLLEVIKEIEGLAPQNPGPEDTHITVGTINGGITANQIPAEASAMLDVRTGSLADHVRLTPQIQAICDKHGVTATFQADEQPCVTDPENPWIKTMVDIVKQITGRSHGTTYDFGMTDGRFFSAKGIPTIVINPECGNIHRDDEWISRSSLAQFCQAVEAYVRQKAARKPAKASDREAEIAAVLHLLDQQKEQTYIWYASYGSGLSKDIFMQQITGGTPEGSSRAFIGCTDQTPPIKDRFLSLPYRLYFAGVCEAWDGGGHGTIEVEPSEARTIARAYLITLEQFQQMVAQQNDQTKVKPLPLKQAVRHGHALIKDATGYYNELVFCGIKDDAPMFCITSNRKLPLKAPSSAYTRLLCKGLSERGDTQSNAVDYVLAAPGIAGNHKKDEIARLFTEEPRLKQPPAKAQKS